MWLLAFSHSALSLPPNQSKAPTSSQYALPKPLFTVPFQYRDHNIWLQGAINGGRPVLFLLDTGSELMLADPHIVKHVTSGGPLQIHELSGSSPATSAEFDSVKIAGTTISKVKGAIAPLGAMRRLTGRPVYGVIGYSLLHRYAIQIDYQKQLIRFWQPGTFAQAAMEQRAIRLPLIWANKDRYSISVEVGNDGSRQWPFVIDTGFSGFISIQSDTARRTGLLDAGTVRVTELEKGLNNPFIVQKIRASHIRIGTMKLVARVVQIDPDNRFAPNGLIGNRFLQNYQVTIDPGAGSMWLDRVTQDEEHDSAARPKLGCDGTWVNGMWRINYVAPWSPAYYAGIEPGDILLEVNDHPVAGSADPLAFIPAKNPKVVGLELSRNGTLYSLWIKPSSPFTWSAPKPNVKPLKLDKRVAK